MSDQEKQLIANLEVVTRGHKGSADEHAYLQSALKYLVERLERAAAADAADEAAKASSEEKKEEPKAEEKSA